MMKGIFFAILSILLCASLSYAQPAELWKTGQTHTSPINPAPSGSDGDIQAGVAWPSPRFTDNLDGTVTDNLTGLIWLKNANCANATRVWATALSDVAQLNTNGIMNGNGCGDTSNNGSHQTDWRLPNRKELRSLIDYSQYNPALPTGHPFINVQSNGYWSSTTYASTTGYAWIVYMHNGGVSAGGKADRNYVWPVRAGLFYNLIITRSGTGAGTVTSNPAGIDCGVDCSKSYASGTVVTLTTTPDAGSIFAGWSGDADCSDGVVTMNAAKTCTATFTPAPGSAPPAISIHANGERYYDEIAVLNPVDLSYDISNFWITETCKEMFFILNAPLIGVNWSYLNAQGQWIPLPQDLGQITPFGCAPGNSEFTLYQGDLPVGDYEIYMGIDLIKNGYLDLYNNNLIYDHLLIHVVQ